LTLGEGGREKTGQLVRLRAMDRRGVQKRSSEEEKDGEFPRESKGPGLRHTCSGNRFKGPTWARGGNSYREGRGTLHLMAQIPKGRSQVEKKGGEGNSGGFWQGVTTASLEDLDVIKNPPMKTCGRTGDE